MCDFCVQHGDGKKWYLQASYYAEDMLHDARRRRMIREFFSSPEKLASHSRGMERLAKAPAFVRRMVSSLATRHMKKRHFGQVVPMEDVEEIFGFINSIVRVPCICRQVNLGRDVGYCYGVSVGPGETSIGDILGELDSSYTSGPDTSAFEILSRSEALEAFAEHETEGLCHTVWTFVTPFIGGICNCDRSDCLAMRATVTHDIKVMWRAEYVAEVNRDLCAGCRACMRVCQFGAIAYSAADRKAFIDQTACYGCGVCRAACPHGAISLRPRAESPVAAGLW